MPTVSKNIFWSTIAALMQIYSGGIIFILMAKMMPINDFGLLSFGFSFGTLLATCMDFGQSLMIMKDYPEKKFDPNHYVLNSMAQKIVYGTFFIGAFFLFLYIFYEGVWVKVGTRFIIFAIISAFVLYFQAILRIKNKFKEFSTSMIIYALVVTGIVIGYFLGYLDLLGFIRYLIYCKFLQAVFSAIMCKEIFQKKWFDLTIQKHLLKNSWSFGAHFIFGTFYFTTDTQIIALLLEAKDVALYQSIFRIIYIFLIVSDITSNVLLPYLSSKYAKRENIDKLSGNIMYLLLIIGCGLFLIFTSYYKEIINILYTPEYILAYPIVIPLSLVILLRTASSIYGTLLTISNNQTNRVKVVFASMILSIALNFTFIPYMGIVAAAWISVFVHFAIFMGYYFYSRKDFPNITMITRENISVLAITGIISIISNVFFSNNFVFTTFLVVVWVLTVLNLIVKDNKTVIIKEILNDKGVI